ncbi:hypothetical protein JX266_007437 [Neoarthrinium moseri]|nr:hypothetical protein JX266_007437 [Neoarthrinium moseri]
MSGRNGGSMAVPAPGPTDHDFASFSSLIVRLFDKLSLSLTLLGVLLDERGPSLPSASSSGSFFQVVLVPAQDLLESRFVPEDIGLDTKSLPELVALKLPVLTDHSNSPRSRKLWSSMAQELQILKNEHIFKHANIVHLQGVCWRKLESCDTIMPVVVLEAAEFGDLATGMQSKEVQQILTLRKALGLAVDIAAGLNALHDVGIAHLDLKPQNILLFKHDKLGIVAKIADFGSSLIVDEVQGEINIQSGTSMWQAPGCDRPVKKHDLYKLDIYSLGLITANLLTGNAIATVILEEMEPEALQDLKTGSDFASLVAKTVDMEMNGFLGRAFYDEQNGEISGTIDEPEANDSRASQSDTISRDREVEDTATSAAYLVFRALGLEEPSQEDLKRVWLFAKSREMIRQASENGRFVPLERITDQDAAHHIQTILDKWQLQKAPKPPRVFRVRSPGAVLEADRSLGTLRIMPPEVIRQIAGQLEEIANDVKQDVLDIQATPFITKALQLLSLSASLGSIEAQGFVAWLYDTFDQHLPSDLEIDKIKSWLESAYLQGSGTAGRHLKTLSEETYRRAKKRLREQRGGIGLELPESWHGPDEQFNDAISYVQLGFQDDDSCKRLYSMLQAFATTGRYRLLRKLIQITTVDVNFTSEFGETPLLMASRSGHTKMVLYLLRKGADPRIASDEGVTPLHFLSSFEDEDMSIVAESLVHHNASLEARSTRAHTYHTVTDSCYGLTNGTPLTWAVAANNLMATKTLIRLGADPFDEASKHVPVGDDWSTIYHTNPVLYAAMNHQWQHLEVLLPSGITGLRSRMQSLLGRGPLWNLQHGSRPVGPWGFIDNSTPLDACVRYSTPGAFKRLLLHGKEHRRAFRKTFELLASNGIDPRATSLRLLQEAAQWGQPFVIRYLMGWKGGIMRPSALEWQRLLALAIRHHDRVVLNALLEYRMSYNIPSKEWTVFFRGIADRTNDADLLQGLVSYLDPSDDFSELVSRSFHAGCPAVGKWFYTNAKCNLAKVYTDGPANGRSLLGMLIVRSKQFSSVLRAVEQFFALPGLPEEVFFDVGIIGGSKFTALHMSVFHAEYRIGSHMRPRILEMVLEQYNEPWQLNFQIKDGPYRGFTPLHIAVITCNAEGVRFLLDEEDVDRDMMTDAAETAMDLALKNFRCQSPMIEFWEVPAGSRGKADMSHFHRSLEIFTLLRQVGAKANKLRAAVVRTEPDDIVLITPGVEEAVVFMPFVPKPLPRELHDTIFFEKASELEVDHCFFIGNPDAIGGSEPEGAVKVDATDLVSVDPPDLPNLGLRSQSEGWVTI